MMYSTSTALNLNLNNNSTPCTTPKTMAATDGTSAKQFPDCPPPPPCRHRASVQDDEIDHDNLHQQQRLRMPYFPHLASLPSSSAAAPASTKTTAVMVTPEKHQQQQQRKRSLFELHQLYSFATFNSGNSITNDRNIRSPQLEPRPSALEDNASLSSPPSSPSRTMAYHNQPLILENLKEWRSFSSMKPQTSAFTTYTSATASTADAASNSTATASMGIPSSKTFDDDDDECNGNSGSIMKQETKRRRRASLLDEFNSRCRLGSIENTRPRFPRAA